MKYVKSLGLALVVTMALTVLLGIGSASATVLCKTQITSGCGSWDYAAGTTFHATLEETATLETLGGTTLHTCIDGTISGKFSNTGGSSETIRGVIETLSWGSPTNPCTKTIDTINNGELEIHWISGTDNGTLTIINTKVTTNTIFGSCIYGSSGAIDYGTITGGNPATIDINVILPKTEGSALCPAEARWTAKYTVTEPTPLYISTN